MTPAGSPFGPQPAPEGELVAARYVLLRRLGRGGVGEVYAAHDRSTGADVALKRMRAEALQRPKLIAQFRAEYHALAQLAHPRIIRVFDYGLDRGVPYYTMELLDGQDVRELAPIPYREACRYLRDVATSLALLHAQRLLHRDVSPRNVRRTLDGQVKLLDFGTMTAFGVPSNVAGTAPFVPPEAAECGFLDQRADLYSLGALGYWMISAENAYPAARLEELPSLWPAPVVALSERVSGLPDALDELIMSLLELDPGKRPTSAAEVIASLNAIAQLEPDDSLELARSYLSSTKLEARAQEVAQVRNLLDRAEAGQGGALWVEGAQGVGKSRMLAEAALLAQTRGMLSLRGYGSSEQSGRGLARQLAVSLARVAPGLIRPAADASPSSEVGLLSAPAAQEPMQGAEERARSQAELSEAFRTLASQRGLLLVIDDLDRADEFSAALVAALAVQARDLPLLIVASASNQPRSESAAAVESFCSVAQRMKLGPLDALSTRKLMFSLLGDVPNLERLVDWLDRAARGNPGLTLALTQLLISRGVVRYVEGTWVLPDGDITESVPRNLAETLALRLERLSPGARALAETVAVKRGTASLELCFAVGKPDPHAALSALDELVAEGVFVNAHGEYAFAQGALGEAVRMTMSPERTRAVHGLLADFLLASPGSSPERRLEAGFHLVHTEQEMRGAEILAQVGPELVNAGTAVAAAIPALEKALEVYERERMPMAKTLPLRAALTLAGYLVDYRVTFRYGHETLALARKLSGLELSARLRRFLGARLALLVGVLWAVLRRPWLKSLRTGPSVAEALRTFGRSLTVLLGVRATALDPAGARALFEEAMPLSGARAAMGRAVFLTSRVLMLQPLGREGELQAAVELAMRAIERVPTHDAYAASAVRNLQVGMRLVEGIMECYRLGPKALALADALEAHGTKLAQAFAQRIRMTYYVVRGERERTAHYRRLIDLHAIQGGSTWQVGWFAVPIEGVAAVRYGDLVTARRALERLEQFAEEVPSLSAMRDMLRIAYLQRRGEHAAALELGERFMAQHAPGSLIGWGAAYASVAGALNALGQHQRARDVCERALAAATPGDLESYFMYALLHIEHSLALTALGEREQAERSIQANNDRLEAAGEFGALLLGHETAVTVASMAGDVAAMRTALAAMRAAAERTGSPSLVAYTTRTEQAHARKLTGTLPPLSSTPSNSPPPADETAVECRDDVETIVEGSANGRVRTRDLLSELAAHTKAEVLHVYLARERGAGVELVASTSYELAYHVPPTLLSAVQELLASQPRSGIEPVGSQALRGMAGVSQSRAGDYELILLASEPGRPRAVVALRRPEHGTPLPASELWTELVETLAAERSA